MTDASNDETVVQLRPRLNHESLDDGLARVVRSMFERQRKRVPNLGTFRIAITFCKSMRDMQDDEGMEVAITICARHATIENCNCGRGEHEKA